MKKKRGTLAILLILAILVLGIGYAATTATLKVNGTLGATADNANFKVYFGSAEAGTAMNGDKELTSANVSAGVDSVNNKLAKFSVTGFTARNDTVTFTYVVKNDSADLNANVEAVVASDFTHNDHFTVTAKFGDSSTATIKHGETATLTVVVNCSKTPIADLAETTVGGIVTLNATAVQATN